MATIIGDSGAWHEITGQLRRCGLNVQQPTDIDPLLVSLRENYQPAVEQKRSEIAEGIMSKELSVLDMRAEKGIIRSFINWFRIRRCEEAIAHLHSEERHYAAVLTENIRRVDALRESGELAGARAEIDVIASLARLSAEHIVFNDIRLTADRHIRFNGVPLRSAQIDHLVLSPAGVFVIETKRWSRNFVQSDDYHNPFEQIQRAAYLCYDQLRRKFGKIRVRSVIANAGQLPPAPKNSYVKVLAVSELIGYISWFRQTELAPDRLQQVRHHLEAFVAR